MRKTKVLKKNKHSKKTRKNRKFCEKGVTDESIRIGKFVIEAKKNNKILNKNIKIDIKTDNNKISNKTDNNNKEKTDKTTKNSKDKKSNGQ